jgi:hypothetical protein
MSTSSTANASTAGPDLNPYQYQPLVHSSGEIRLIKIHCAQESQENGPNAVILLEISLFHTPLDQASPYLAVSYAWGNPTPTHKLLVNGAPLWVPSSTFRTLYTIHCSVQTTNTELYQAGEEVALWIDAVCINQLDIAEKEVQVPRMGQIYRQARGAIGYIGAPPAGKRSEDALAWVGNAPVIEPPDGVPADQSDHRFQARYREYQIQSKPPEDFGGALTELFVSDWFGRCWVIQEMVFSRETVCLYGYGQKFESWSLSTMAMLINHGYNHAAQRRDLARAVKGRDGGGGGAGNMHEMGKALQVETWQVLREELVKKPGGLGVVDLLSLTRESKATDSRDKVYALLGLMKAEDVRAIRVEYSDSYPAAHLFLDVAVHCMANAEGPMTLVHAGLERSIPNLPTWVPDWSAKHRSPLATGIYKACANLFRPINVLPGGRKISALGIKVDAIAYTGIPMSYSDAHLQVRDTTTSTRPDVVELVLFAAIICGRLRERLGGATGYVLKHENWSDVIWRTCCMDRNWAGKRVTAEDRVSFQACLRRFGFGEDVLAAVKVDEVTGRAPFDDASWVMEDKALREAALGFELVTFELQQGRVLGMTVGGLFGSFPSTARAGDVVVVLLGGLAPFVLRPVGEDVFELVGAAYVHGIMDGGWVQAALAEEDTELFREFVVQ